MARLRTRKHRSRKNRTRRGGDPSGDGIAAPAQVSSYNPTSLSNPALSTYSSPVASTTTNWYDKLKKSFSWTGGKRKRRGGFKPYDPLQLIYGSAKGGRRRKSRKSRRSRR